MRSRIIAVTILLGLWLPAVAQNLPTTPAEAATEQVSAPEAATRGQASYPIAGSHLLWRQNAELARLAAEHPELLSSTSLRKAAWSFSVGSTHTWYADDFTNSTRYQVASTCKAVGTHCYVFAEDASWTSGYINQTVVDSVTAAFDSRTPADPTKGIYDIDTQTFGNPPDVDGDPKIIILILDIRDGYTGSGGYVAGYFYAYNEFPASGSTPTSNVAEIYFLDCHPASLTTAAGLKQGMSTTAHEFQHMIHWNYDQSEITFVNESCSEVAEVVNGFKVYDQTLYASEPDRYLFDWRSGDNTNVLKDYSRAARFSLYLRDQFGAGVFKPIVASPLTGSAGIDAGLATFGTARRFADILPDWFTANILDDTTVNAKYGYKYAGLAKMSGHIYAAPNVPLSTDTVQMLAADYFSFISGTDLRATFAWSSPSVSVKAVEIGSGGKQVVNVTSGVEFHEPAFGTTYTQVHFVVMNTSPSAPGVVSYSASGPTSSVELKYDSGVPAAYLGLQAGDTVAVLFNGVPGGTIDSIRVALRRTGAISAGIYKYAGALRPSPNAAPLAVGLTATGTQTPGVPYPIPWPNWATINVSSLNLPSDNAFVVAFTYTGDPTVQQRVMSDSVNPPPSQVTSWAYYQDGGSPNWYILTTPGGGGMWTYMIRAYVSFKAAANLTVYPGDANNDGIVDARDILPIGRFFGKTGTARAGGSLTWTGQSMVGIWTPTEAAYADCDGNGTVDANDVQGIINNWGNSSGGALGAVNRRQVCEDLLKMIDAQGPPSGGMLEVRKAIVAYMRSTLGIAMEFALEQNWPNPFNPTTTIRFTIPQDVTDAKLVVFNTLGQQVWAQTLGPLFTGTHTVSWDGRTNAGMQASSGIYIYQLTAGPYRSAKRMALIK